MLLPLGSALSNGSLARASRLSWPWAVKKKPPSSRSSRSRRSFDRRWPELLSARKRRQLPGAAGSIRAPRMSNPRGKPPTWPGPGGKSAATGHRASGAFRARIGRLSRRLDGTFRLSAPGNRRHTRRSSGRSNRSGPCRHTAERAACRGPQQPRPQGAEPRLGVPRARARMLGPARLGPGAWLVKNVSSPFEGSARPLSP